MPVDCKISSPYKGILWLDQWEYQKLRGHRLAMRYLPYGDDRDLAAWGREQNQTRAQAMIAAMGDRLELISTKVQQDDYGTLMDVEVLGTRARFVRVVCPSTSKVYFLTANPNLQTAKEAVAASFGMSINEYKPTQEA